MVETEKKAMVDNGKNNASVSILNDKGAMEEVRFGHRISMNPERQFRAQKMIEEFCNDSKKRNRNSPVIQSLDYALNNSRIGQFTTSIGTEIRTLYRARIVTEENCSIENGISIDEMSNTIGFNEENSLDPPFGKSYAGRNNMKGMPYLYLSKDPETACIEIKGTVGSIISVAEIEVNKNLNLFDFTKTEYTSEPGEDDLDYSAILNEIVSLFHRPVGRKKDYVATQIISDYIRKVGFDGISYVSNYTGSMNYTIFNCHHKYFRLKASWLVAIQGTIQYYWDFNKKRMLMSNVNNIDYCQNRSKRELEIAKIWLDNRE